MKAFTKTLAVVGLSFGAMGMANASPELTPADTAVTSKICVTAATGSKLKLRNALEDAGLTKHYVENNVTCNGLPIVEFVAQYSDNPDSINAFITSGKYVADNYIASVKSRH